MFPIQEASRSRSDGYTMQSGGASLTMAVSEIARKSIVAHSQSAESILVQRISQKKPLHRALFAAISNKNIPEAHRLLCSESFDFHDLSGTIELIIPWDQNIARKCADLSVSRQNDLINRAQILLQLCSDPEQTPFSSLSKERFLFAAIGLNNTLLFDSLVQHYKTTTDEELNHNASVLLDAFDLSVKNGLTHFLDRMWELTLDYSMTDANMKDASEENLMIRALTLAAQSARFNVLNWGLDKLEQLQIHPALDTVLSKLPIQENLEERAPVAARIIKQGARFEPIRWKEELIEAARAKNNLYFLFLLQHRPNEMIPASIRRAILKHPEIMALGIAPEELNRALPDHSCCTIS